MKKKHYAAIDIGSNAVRLLVKCTSGNPQAPLSKVLLVRVPIRLGEDAFIKGRIGHRKAKELVLLMKAYKNLMKIYEIEAFRACATSAMREASNAADLVKTVKEKTGIGIEIIGGEEEATLISKSGLSKAVTQQGNFLFVDVGGGSTELSLFINGTYIKRESFNIGTVRTLSGMVHTSTRQLFANTLDKLYKEHGSCVLVGSGGNINRLVRLKPSGNTADGTPFISTNNLQTIYEELTSISEEERMVRFNLKPDRADVIVPAAAIFLQIARALHAPHIVVPTLGIADGIIEALYDANINKDD